MRTCPDSTTYSPAHGSPSLKTASPEEKRRGTASLGQEGEFRFREPREDLDLRQCLSVVNLDFRHGGYCTEAG